jgi:hypothetical protein
LRSKVPTGKCRPPGDFKYKSIREFDRRPFASVAEGRIRRVCVWESEIFVIQQHVDSRFTRMKAVAGASVDPISRR